MFRRARFSVKPNVRPSAAGRGNSGGSGSSTVTPAGPDAAPHDSGPATCAPPAAVASSIPQPAAAGNLQQGCGGGSSSSSSRDGKTNDASSGADCSRRTETVLQRRKRISTMPNLVKPRIVSPSVQRGVNSASKRSPKQIPPSPTCGNSPLQKESSSSDKINIENSPKSPMLPEKKTPVPQVPQFSPFKKSGCKEASVCAVTHRSDEAYQKNASSPLKERPTQERMVQEEISHSKTPPTEGKKPCSDHEKRVKAQKLRQMLKEELKNEKQRKCKYPIIEKRIPEDRSKMIMRDFIYYLPENNPMKSSLVEEKKSEKTSTVTQAKEPEEKIVEHEDENEEAEEEEGQEDDGPLLVPRVKVAEDGSIILDEESLTVEVLRTKGQCVVEENDPIFERGSTTTYSSFRKHYYSKPWSEKETDMFFLAISMVGTDFSMISQLFPHRARTEIKNKFKREEKTNGWRIDKAFKEKKRFDFDFFAKLLEKVLENERRKKEKDSKCQHKKEKTPNEKKTTKPPKKRKAKATNGQPSCDQDARRSDAEMEVDAETAEKENEEALSLLDQMTEGGQVVTEPVVMKKKKKRKKKDSEQEPENPSDGKAAPAEITEGKGSRKKRKTASSSVAPSGVGEDLENSGREIPDETLLPVEEDLSCCLQLTEDTEGESSLASSSVQESASIEVADELCLVGQSSKDYIPPSSNKDGFEETNETQQNEATELDKKSSTPAPTHDDTTETTETDRASTGKPTVKGQPEKVKTNLTTVSGKRESPVNNTSEVKVSPSKPMEVKVSPSKPMDASEKSTVEDKATKVTAHTIEESTERTNSDKEKDPKDTQKEVTDKTEVRSSWLRPKANLVKEGSKQEAQGELPFKTVCPESSGTVEKTNVQDDPSDIAAAETTETDCEVLKTESRNCEKSALPENSKRAVLKPALLARGRMVRPKPNLGRAAKRQAEQGKNVETEAEKVTAAVEVEKTLTHNECTCDEGLTKDTTEESSNEADMSCSKILAIASSEADESAQANQLAVVKQLECESYGWKKAPLSRDLTEHVSNLVSRDSKLQQEEKDISAEVDYSLNTDCQKLKENLVKAAEGKEASGDKKDTHETETAEESSAINNSESSKSNLNEAGKRGTLPFSNLLDEHHAGAQEMIAAQTPLLNLSGLENDEPKEVLLSPDSQEKISLGKQSSQHENQQSTLRPAPLLRGRFQRPKPNIGRAAGKKDLQSSKVEEAVEAAVGTEKSTPQKSEPARISCAVAQLMCDSQLLPTEVSENTLADCNKEDTHMPSTSQHGSKQYAREKSTAQEDKPCTIKPAQLARGRSQRAMLSLGRGRGRGRGKKEVPVPEYASVPTEGEVGKPETEMTVEGRLYSSSQDEVNVQTSLSNLEEEGKSQSNENSCVQQKQLSSPEKSQECELLKSPKESCVSRDVEQKSASDIAASQEIKNIKPTQLTRALLHRPKPNLVRAAKRKEASSEGGAGAEGEKRKDTDDSVPKSVCGSKSGNISTLMHDSGKLVETTSSPKCLQQNNCPDSFEAGPPKRSRNFGKCETSEGSSGGESRQKERKNSKTLSVPESAPETSTRKQPGRTLKQLKSTCDSRTSSASEYETDHSEKGRSHRKGRPNVSKGRSLKGAIGKKSRKECGNAKVSLVTLRASSQEEDDDDDDDADDFEPDYEVECFSPEEVNKAPVFVPKGLRSPNPVSVHIEETMEELEIYENVPDEPFVAPVQTLPHELSVAAKQVMQGDRELRTSNIEITQEKPDENTGIIDGSTEAAMTLLTMRDPLLQLKSRIQEKTEDVTSQDKHSIADILPNEHSEEQSVVHSNVPSFGPSKTELVASDSTNKASAGTNSAGQSSFENYIQEAVNLSFPVSSKHEVAFSQNSCTTAPENHHTSSLRQCSQETTSDSSDLSSSTQSKTSRLARCRFPKPKPNLSRGLGLTKKAPQKSLGVSAGVEQPHSIQTEVLQKNRKNATEEPEQCLRLDDLVQSNPAKKHDLQSGGTSQITQENSIERENLERETREAAPELTAPKAETCLPEPPPSYASTNINAQHPENVSGPVEYHLSSANVAQMEAGAHSSISAATEMTSVTGGIKEYPELEAEQTFILTLVEISTDLEDCGGTSALQPQASGELLPAPIFSIPDNVESVELTREDSAGIAAAVSKASTTEMGGLQEASAKPWTDLGPTSCEERCNPKEKKKCFMEKSLTSYDKETLFKSNSVSRKAAEKNSEKSNTLKTTNISPSQSIPETAKLQVEDREQAGCPPNLGARLFEEAGRTNEPAASGPAATSKEQTVDPCKSALNGNPALLSKMQLSRPHQKSLGFLPLLCKTNTDEVTAEPQISMSKSTDECPTLSSRDKKEDTDGNSSPSSISSPSKCENVSSSTAQVLSESSENESSSKEPEKEAEPTRISEYFFSDIFMEVDDAE